MLNLSNRQGTIHTTWILMCRIFLLVTLGIGVGGLSAATSVAHEIPPQLEEEQADGDPLINDAPPSSAVSFPLATTYASNITHSKLTYDFSFHNDGPGTVTQLTVYFAIPTARDNQSITGLTFSAPYTLLTDRYGQAVAQFQFANVGAGQEVAIAWQADVEIWAVDYALDPAVVLGLEHVPADILSAYTGNESMYRLDSPVIQAAAVTAAGGATNPYWIARNVHDFVANRLTYINDGDWDDAETAYTQQHGSCTEYTWLFIALCRANGIPARYVAGSHHRQAGDYVDTVFHRWAEIYLPPYGWVPVDVTWDDSGDILRHTYFGAVSERCFVTTVSGGNSEYLGWNYNYNYWYLRSGEVNITRERYFTWVPYPSELRIIPSTLSGMADPNTQVGIGYLNLVSTNGAYDWALNSGPLWLSLLNQGMTPATITVTADATGLPIGVYTDVLDFRSASLDQNVGVPVRLIVAELVRTYLPLVSRGY